MVRRTIHAPHRHSALLRASAEPRLAILATLLLSGVADAYASPRTDPTVGRTVFTGAATPSATAIDVNPAALGLGSVDELYFAFTGVLDRVGIQRRTLDPNTGDLAPGESINDTEAGAGGTFVYVRHVGEYVTLGIGAHSPPPEMFPRNFDALRYHTLGDNQRNLIATFGASIRAGSALRFGASLSHDNAFLHLKYARDTALETGINSDCGGSPCGFENPQASELYDVKVRSDIFATSNVRLNLGIAARLYDDVWLGVGYHTPPGFDIQSALGGHMQVTRAPRDGEEVLKGDSVVYVHYPASVDVEVRAKLPQHLELHVGGRWEDLSRMQAYDVRGYGSTFRGTVPEWTERPRGFVDPFALWAGIEQLDVGGDGLLERLTFGGRLGVETAATEPDATSPTTIAPTSFTADLGVRLRASNLLLQLTYGFQFFPEVNVTNSAFDPRFQLDCAASGFDYNSDACAASRNGFAIPTAAGDYRRFEHALRFALIYELH